MSHNIDLLRGACLANGVAIDGRSYEELRVSLGGVLVDKMLGSPPTSPDKSTFDVPKKKQKRTPSRWHQFVKAETGRVRSGMPHLKGHEVLAEVRPHLPQSATRRGAPPYTTVARPPFRLHGAGSSRSSSTRTRALSCSPTQALPRLTARTESSKALHRS